ncbi:APC family permease [Aurantimonas sp. VKM B-3413]|uniref:APC family permease n=1 Tax=Aurantimonas sp. VKM B-3413 TaxID=2779401 RepID=UPI001E65B0D0|nr:APC family permease [Aurantimonas sp. VKM B-3413]MCB8836288.1 APC family permease [Aurantimonas sp. VKM B-3413]
MTNRVAAQQQDTRHLAKNSIGLAHIVFFVVAAAAPLTAVVGASPVAFAFGNGVGVPGAYLLAGILYLVFSAGFTAMSRYVGNAGGFYAYIKQGLGTPAGIGGAMIAIVTYYAVQIAVYALFGVFLAGALDPFGIVAPWWVWSIGALVVIYFCGRRNIAFSGTILAYCMVAEVAILLLLDVAIVLAGGGPEGIGFASFAPSEIFAPGLGVALVFVLASFIGFEATAIFAEEAETPERTIPRATYMAVTLIAVFYAFSTWAIVQHYGPGQIVASSEGALETLYFDASGALLGAWSVVVMNVLLITSLFAALLSFHNTINRYFFALGRESVAPSALGAVHVKHGSPHVASLVQSLIAAAIILAFVVGGQDPYAVVFSWMSALAVVGIIAVQVLVCLAVIRFFRKRPALEVGPIRAVIAPLVSAVGLVAAFVLVSANLSLLSGSDSLIVASFPYLIVLVGLAGAAFAMWLRSARPQVYSSLGKAFE